MPKCNQCQKDFPNRVYINGKCRNLQNRKFCVECSPFGSHNTKPTLETTVTIEEKTARRKAKQVEYTTRRRQKVMKMAIDYKGGKCIVCGYNKCTWALEFHHIDPKEKEFSISDKGYTRSWDKVKIELDKCVLLCANCHREVEAGFTQL